MKTYAKLFIAISIFVSGSFATAATPSSFSSSSKKLTAAQCVKLRSDLTIYIAKVEAWVNAQPVKYRAYYKSIADALIAEAIKLTNRLCPVPPPPSNGYSPNSPYECQVLNEAGTALAILGLNSSGGLSATAPVKTLCMSVTACSAIVGQRLQVFGSDIAARCQDPNDATVQHLTDAELQTKINAIP